MPRRPTNKPGQLPPSLQQQQQQQQQQSDGQTHQLRNRASRKKGSQPPVTAQATTAPATTSRSSAKEIAAKRKMYRRRRITVGSLALLLVVLIAGTGFVVWQLVDIKTGIRSSKIAGVPQSTSETNILVMGLDSRVDQNGNPLPQEVYDAIHAGDQNDGGYNTNVLMLIHIPSPGKGKAVGISIPRDNYVQLTGVPDGTGDAIGTGTTKGKIKEAYGIALDQKLAELTDQGLSESDAYQQARSFARQAEIKTVSDFLGGVPIDHFIEVTMAAFYSVAQAVEPITVCLNQATQDKYSGADFRAGVQEISANQAMSFVRQRRDTGPTDFNLTDLDRTRRQQAFIVSLAVKLRKSNLFTDFGNMRKLIDTAKQYVAIDDRLDLLSFAQQAQRISGGEMTFQTLPIIGYDTIRGQDVNIVDTAAIQAEVHRLLSPDSTVLPSATSTSKLDVTATVGTTGPEPAEPDSSPAERSTPDESPQPSNVYTDAESPLSSGTVPCVN